MLLVHMSLVLERASVPLFSDKRETEKVRHESCDPLVKFLLVSEHSTSRKKEWMY